MNDKVCLIVEGGGMRGFFSAGILQTFLEEGISFPHVIGVSSGAFVAAAYVAARLDFDFSRLTASLSSFVNLHALLKPDEGLLRCEIIMDFLSKGCYEHVLGSQTILNICATDATSAELVWWDQSACSDGEDLRSRMIASASIPVVMKKAFVDGRVFADGGIRNSIPIQQGVDCGFDKFVLILSRPRGYVKPKQHFELYLRHWLKPYPALKKAMALRHVYYNESIRRAEQLEDEGSAFVLRSDAQNLARFEYNPDKFKQTYLDGKAYARNNLGALQAFLRACEV